MYDIRDDVISTLSFCLKKILVVLHLFPWFFRKGCHPERGRSSYSFGFIETNCYAMENDRTGYGFPELRNHYNRAHTTAYSRRRHWLLQRDDESVVEMGFSQPFLANY